MDRNKISHNYSCEICGKRYNGVYLLCIPCIYKEKEKLALEMLNKAHGLSLTTLDGVRRGGEFDNDLRKEREYATDIVHRKWFDKDWKLNYKNI